MADFAKLGATVVGISPDDINTLVKFQRSTGVVQRLVSDPGMKDAQAFGVVMTDGADRFVKRETLIIGKDGSVLYDVFDWSPLTNASQTYDWLKSHPQT